MINLLQTYMVAFPHRFHFTERDRRECFDIIATVMKLVYREREINRLNLEEDAYQTDIFFLKKALFLFIDNVDHETVSHILTNYIIFGEYEGKELLEKIIILDGITSLYEEENPSVIEEKLKAYIGEKLMFEYDIFRENIHELNVKKVEEPKKDVFPSFTFRERISTEPVNSSRILSQSEIDDLLKTLIID